MSNAAAEAYGALATLGGVVDLSARVKLVLTGADRVRYLNGQVTSNVQKLVPGQAQAACVTTAKGKLCAEIAITATADALWIDADPSLQESLPPRLERYIIADDVQLEESPEETRLIHFLGEKPTWLNVPEPNGTLPPLVAHARFGRPGWDWWTDAQAWQSAQSEIENRLVIVDEALAEVLRVEAGIPRWGYELTEDTLPPEAGLDRTHIDYHKGCYIGQEVISRLKSVGHVNRQLTGFVAQDGPLTPGAALFAPGEEGRSVGILTSAVFSFALEKPIALGYLRRGSPTGELHARPAAATEPPATVIAQSLPFLP